MTADHDHAWGPVEAATFTGNPHRKCAVAGCWHVSLDLDDLDLDDWTADPIDLGGHAPEPKLYRSTSPTSTDDAGYWHLDGTGRLVRRARAGYLPTPAPAVSVADLAVVAVRLAAQVADLADRLARLKLDATTTTKGEPSTKGHHAMTDTTDAPEGDPAPGQPGGRPR